MNKIIRTILTLSILYWTMFYVVDADGFWLPIPFILIGVIWFYDYGTKKDYTERYEIKQNNSGEYYVWDNKAAEAKELGNSSSWYPKGDYYFHKNCLTTNKELATLIYNRIIS